MKPMMEPTMNEEKQTPPSGLALQVDPLVLQPLIRHVVEETIAALDAERAKVNGRLAYFENEAAALMGMQPYQLRDERLRGRIQGSVGPRKRILYTRDDLIAYLQSRRWSATAEERGQ
jgi:hypothetical protein